MQSYLDTFKDYVPAEILAAFITINSIVPYEAPLDIYVVLAAIVVLVAFFIVASLKSNRIPSKGVVAVVAFTLPFWCFMIAMERFDNYVPSDRLRILVSVLLVITSLGLTLFARQKKHEDQAAQ